MRMDPRHAVALAGGLSAAVGLVAPGAMCLLWPPDQKSSLRLMQAWSVSTLGLTATLVGVRPHCAQEGQPAYDEYADSALVHVHTRSIANMITKAYSAEYFGEAGFAKYRHGGNLTKLAELVSAPDAEHTGTSLMKRADLGYC